jgi:PAS domain S-box-containing protein
LLADLVAEYRTVMEQREPQTTRPEPGFASQISVGLPESIALNPETNNSISSKVESETLRWLVQGIATETGASFFRSLVRSLAEALGTHAAWVTEYLPEENKLRALALWLDRAFVDHYEYHVPGTPCEPVVQDKTLIHFPERIIELFPTDSKMLSDVGAVSFMGMPLLDLDGRVLGHLAVLDNKPMPRDARTIALFEIFAARAAAEHRRLKAELELKEREEQLTMLIDSAMDAIVVLDDSLKIFRTNKAAERVFGCTCEDMEHESINDFLASESASRVKSFVEEIQTRPSGEQQLWVPQDFVARRWDHTVFPAEATLSRFECRDETYYALILRNVDERVEAERKIQELIQETEYLREAVRELPGRGELIGRSDAMSVVFDSIKQVAPTDSTVLITGETGTGKELVARSIHRASRRADQPLITVNCAAIPASLIESEFFGHEKGAFTGATTRREGRFALADGGTIFLDEIGELPLELQAKLLRVLQEGEFEPVGSSRTRKVNVRVIAASHRDLKHMSADGTFREDLYFRLNVFPISIPPLRQRARDVETLANAFARQFGKRMGKLIEPFTQEQLKQLRNYDWPGNVRELQNVIERAVILTNRGPIELERALCGMVNPTPAEMPRSDEPNTRIRTAKEMTAQEADNIRRALAACDWKVSGEQGAARLLGIPASTLSSRIKALKIHQ